MQLVWSRGLVCLVLATAACSSDDESIDVAALLANDAAAEAAAAPEATPGNADGTATTIAGASSSPAGGRGAGGSTNPAGSPGGGAAAPGPTDVPVGGRGITAEEIAIGVELIAPLAGGAAAIGGKGADTGNTQAQAEAMVAYVNGHGGLAGRRVVPVFRETNQEANWDAEAQANCAHFTEDNEVFLVVTAVLSISPNLAPCLAGRGTPSIVQGRTVLDDTDLRALSPYVYLPGRMSPTRWGTVTVDGLAAAGWVEAGMALGLVSFDRPQHLRTADQVMIPRLASRGVEVTERIVVRHPGGLSGFGDSSAQISNGILRMRSSGVDHVMILDDHGMLGFLFMPQAEGQGWRPKYGLNSLNQGITMKQNAPAAQLPGVTMVGWVTTDDVLDEQDPGGNPTKERCLGIMKDAGIEYPARVAVASALGYCDAFLFLQAALDGAPSLDAAGLRAGVDNLGDRYLSPVGFATRHEPGRFDGGAAYRALRYDSECECFEYVGPVVAAP